MEHYIRATEYEFFAESETEKRRTSLAVEKYCDEQVNPFEKGKRVFLSGCLERIICAIDEGDTSYKEKHRAMEETWYADETKEKVLAQYYCDMQELYPFAEKLYQGFTIIIDGERFP